jgi:hypothetical protein
MSLGQVIYKLSDQQPRAHIPYRDSKLTRLLQPSLSGNAQVVCVCNISPSVSHIEESHNTLKFATRAKKIQQRVVLNEVSDQNTLLQEYKDEIDALKQQLAAARAEYQQHQNDEDARELVLAIQKMEALILKTHTFQKEHDDVILDTPDSGELLLSPEFASNTPATARSLTVDTTITTAMGKSPLLDEMERIQGLLGNVLTKQGRSIAPGTSGGSASDMDLASMAKREEEVEELRNQLQEMEVSTSLKRADTSFLQSQLQQKDMLLAEVAQILEVVEQRQIELETDNNLLTRMVIEKDRKLALKDRRIADKEREIVQLKSKLR